MKNKFMRVEVGDRVWHGCNQNYKKVTKKVNIMDVKECYLGQLVEFINTDGETETVSNKYNKFRRSRFESTFAEIK